MTTTIRLGALAVLGVFAAAVPAAHADRPQYPQDDNIWATTVAAGQTEHGVWTAGNVNDPHDWFFRRNKYGDLPPAAGRAGQPSRMAARADGRRAYGLGPGGGHMLTRAMDAPPILT